jgi:hypothetical protein
VIFNSFAGSPAALQGTFTIKRGVVQSSDLRLDGRKATALTKGTANLPAWRLDSLTDIYLAENPNTPYLTVGLRGPLDAPSPRLSGLPLQRQPQAAPSLLSGPQPSGQTQQQPQPAPEKLKPEDILRKGAKDLLTALDRLPPRSSSTFSMIALIEVPSTAAISFSARQNGSSRLRLVLCPAMETERFLA